MKHKKVIGIFKLTKLLKFFPNLANSSPENKDLAEKLTLSHLRPYGAADPQSPIEKAESRATLPELFKYPDESIESRRNKQPGIRQVSGQRHCIDIFFFAKVLK